MPEIDLIKEAKPIFVFKEKETAIDRVSDEETKSVMERLTSLN